MDKIKAGLWTGVLCASALFTTPAISESNTSMVLGEKPGLTAHARLRFTIIVRSALSLTLDAEESIADQLDLDCSNTLPTHCNTLSWEPEPNKSKARLTIAKP